MAEKSQLEMMKEILKNQDDFDNRLSHFERGYTVITPEKEQAFINEYHDLSNKVEAIMANEKRVTAHIDKVEQYIFSPEGILTNFNVLMADLQHMKRSISAWMKVLTSIGVGMILGLFYIGTNLVEKKLEGVQKIEIQPNQKQYEPPYQQPVIDDREKREGKKIKKDE